MRRRLTTALGLATLISAATLAIPSPASAGTNCNGGFHCVFYLGFSSARHSFYDGDRDFRNDRFDEGGVTGRNWIVNDEVWSASNSSSRGYFSYWYEHPELQGRTLFCIAPGSQVENLPDGQRDLASSFVLSHNYWPPCY